MTPSAPVPPRAPLLLALATLLWFGAAGCVEPPDERVRQAWKAAELEDDAAFVGLFTARSAELLRGITQADERTRGALAYLRDITEVLPTGEVVEVKKRDNLALVTVKGAGDRYDVRLLKERGEWRIDLFGQPALWTPLTARLDL